jgi:hypothetical protein
MGKIIEEKFELKHKNHFICITARNYNSHQFFTSSSSGSHTIHLTTDEMRQLSNFLIKTAQEIDNDEDFNQNKKQ